MRHVLQRNLLGKVGAMLMLSLWLPGTLAQPYAASDRSVLLFMLGAKTTQLGRARLQHSQVKDLVAKAAKGDPIWNTVIYAVPNDEGQIEQEFNGMGQIPARCSGDLSTPDFGDVTSFSTHQVMSSSPKINYKVEYWAGCYWIPTIQYVETRIAEERVQYTKSYVDKLKLAIDESNARTASMEARLFALEERLAGSTAGD